jgi:hypothetical protein
VFRPPTISRVSGPWTFYSPSVYLAMNKIIVARDYLPLMTYNNHILTLDASDLSSQVRSCSDTQHLCGLEARPFNFADLQGPVPASAYYGPGFYGSVLFNGRYRETIVDGNYWPRVVIPKEITSIAPDLFASCSLWRSFPVRTSRYPQLNGTVKTITIPGYHAGMLDPPVRLVPITGTISQPSLVLTGESKPHPSKPIIGEQHRSLHTPVSTLADFHPIIDSQDDSPTGLLPTSVQALRTKTSRSTSSALPDSLLAEMGSRTILIGGPALTLDNNVISRAWNGDYIIESSQIYDLRSNMVGKPSPTRLKGDQTGHEQRSNDGAVTQTSGETRNAGSISWRGGIYAFSLMLFLWQPFS